MYSTSHNYAKAGKCVTFRITIMKLPKYSSIVHFVISIANLKGTFVKTKQSFLKEHFPPFLLILEILRDVTKTKSFFGKMHISFEKNGGFSSSRARTSSGQGRSYDVFNQCPRRLKTY